MLTNNSTKAILQNHPYFLIVRTSNLKYGRNLGWGLVGFVITKQTAYLTIYLNILYIFNFLSQKVITIVLSNCFDATVN